MSEVDITPAPQEIGSGEPVLDAQVEESSTSPEETPPEPPKVAKGVQKRLDELTAQRRDAVDREQRAVRESEFLRQQLLQAQQKPQEPQAPVAGSTEPKLEDFSDYAEFTRASARWEARQEWAAIRAEEAQAASQHAKAEQARTFQTRVSAFAATVPDFADTVLTPNAVISIPIAEACAAIEKGPEVLYYLGKNRDEAVRLYNLDPISAAIEVGRILASLPKPRTTQAPPPIDPISGGIPPIDPIQGGVGTGSVDPMSQTADEWQKEQNRKKWERYNRTR